MAFSASNTERERTHLSFDERHEEKRESYGEDLK